jgi:hypothetical protein
MSDFFKRGFQTQTTPIASTAKIKIVKNDVSMQFLLAKDIGRTYKVEFIITLYPIGLSKNPNIVINPSTINMLSLRQAILEKIDAYDRKYMILKTFDHRKAVFELDSEKWFYNNFNNATVRTELSHFSRSIYLKERIPLMIRMDPMMNLSFDKFLIRNFQEFMESKKKEATYFKYLIPESLRKKFRTGIREMFDWTYDSTTGKILATLKTIYIIAILYGIGYIGNKIKKEDAKNIESELKDGDKQSLFAVEVKKNLKQFDYAKFERYSKRRSFF